jgi:hypothetical protein
MTWREWLAVLRLALVLIQLAVLVWALVEVRLLNNEIDRFG